jgi:hypothetical protein
LAPVLGKDATITYLVPPVLLLLRDAASDVRVNLISSLSALNEVIGVDLLSQSLLPAILDLAQDGKWRIRLAIIQNIPSLAEQLGREFFTERLTPLCVGWLGDDIASIRHAAAENLKVRSLLFWSNFPLRNIHLVRVDHYTHSVIRFVSSFVLVLDDSVWCRMGCRTFITTNNTDQGTCIIFTTINSTEGTNDDSNSNGF